MTIIIKSPNVSTTPGLIKFRVDPLLSGDDGGVKFLFDFPSSIGWPSQAAPVNGTATANLATTAGLMELGDGSWNIAAGQAPTFAGGGVDFSGATLDPIALVGPAGALQSIYDAANDYFLMGCYIRLPSAADWNTVATIAPFFCCTSGGVGYTAPEADLITLAMSNTPGITMRRQTAGATAAQINVTSSMANFQGQVCQIGAWRNAAGIGLRLKSSLGEQSATAVVGANNAEDFSTKQPRWGVPDSFNTLQTGSGNATSHRATHKTRLYRGWIEDLTQSGRNPLTVLDADWARVQSRIATSAAAHDGTSQIFV